MNIALGFGDESFWHQSISCPKGIPGVEGRSRGDSGIALVKSTCHPCHCCSLSGQGMRSHHSWGNQGAAQGAACTPRLQGKRSPNPAANRSRGDGGCRTQPCEGVELSWTLPTLLLQRLELNPSINTGLLVPLPYRAWHFLFSHICEVPSLAGVQLLNAKAKNKLAFWF